MTSKNAADTTHSRLVESLERACGKQFLRELYDDDVIELMLNPDGQLWRDSLSNGMSCIGTMSASNAESMIRQIAGANKKVITEDSPYLETNFPLDGSRFAAQIPPIVKTPTFALRKRAVSVFTLDQYVEQGIMSEGQAEAIRKAIRDHRNVLICGGTGSGKTTLLNAVIAEMVRIFPNERIVIMEDTPEVQCTAQNAVVYRTSIDMSMSRLIQITLRMRPDRILVGEVRGSEALSLLESWNTGHEGGAATVHCNSAEDAITRLILMVSKNSEAPRNIEMLISSVVDVIVYIEKVDGKRKVQQVTELSSSNDGNFLFKSIV